MWLSATWMDKGSLAFSGLNGHKGTVAGLALVTGDDKELTLRLIPAKDIQYSIFRYQQDYQQQHKQDLRQRNGCRPIPGLAR